MVVTIRHRSLEMTCECPRSLQMPQYTSQASPPRTPRATIAAHTVGVPTATLPELQPPLETKVAMHAYHPSPWPNHRHHGLTTKGQPVPLHHCASRTRRSPSAPSRIRLRASLCQAAAAQPAAAQPPPHPRVTATAPQLPSRPQAVDAGPLFFEHMRHRCTPRSGRLPRSSLPPHLLPCLSTPPATIGPDLAIPG